MNIHELIELMMDSEIDAMLTWVYPSQSDASIISNDHNYIIITIWY